MSQEIVITEDEIDRELEDLGKRMEGYDEINSMLRERDDDESSQGKIKKQLMIRRLQDIQIRSRVVISPAEIESFYKENRKVSADCSRQDQVPYGQEKRRIPGTRDDG